LVSVVFLVFGGGVKIGNCELVHVVNNHDMHSSNFARTEHISQLLTDGGFDYIVPSATTPTIQSAIDLAGSHEEIFVSIGTYHENISIISTENNPKSNIYLIGEDPFQTFITGTS